MNLRWELIRYFGERAIRNYEVAASFVEAPRGSRGEVVREIAIWKARLQVILLKAVVNYPRRKRKYE